MEEILVVVRYGLLPPANEVWGKVISLQACVCPQEREYLTRYTHPPTRGADTTPPGADTPGTRYTPRSTHPQDQVLPTGPGTPPTQDQVHPPPGTRYTPHLGPGTPPTWDQVHPPGPGAPPGPGTSPVGPGTPPGTRYNPQTRYTPLREQVHPPRTRYTPRDQVHPPGTRYTPRDQVHPPLQSMLGDMVNARAVRILLECNLVHTKRLCLLRRRLYFGVLSRHTIMCENTFLVIYLFISISAFDKMSHLSFEKDDDSNGHIDFITAASVRCDQCQTC